MKISYLRNFLTPLLLLFGTSLYADTNEDVRQAFHKINAALYEIEETRDYCNRNFSSFIQRNNNAYDEWELQYSFFLKDFDSKYAQWKSGFNPSQKQQFSALENIHRAQVRSSVGQDYEDGAQDKCYNFKPALTRPRNNLELNYQFEINLIREQSLQQFSNARTQNGAHQQCSWQQQQAITVIENRDKGIDIKSQKKDLKAYKKENAKLDKKILKERLDAYSDMISESYQLSTINSKTFSLYRFSLCERELADLKNRKLKEATSALIECQNAASEEDGLLGSCISKAIADKK